MLCVAGGAAYFYYPKFFPGTAEAQSQAARGGKDDKGGAHAIPVIAALSRQGDMPVYLNGLGSVTAFNTVTVRSRVDGEIIKIAFTEGQLVKKDDLLVEIDPRPFQVMLEAAEAQKAKDQAQLAKREYSTCERYKVLFGQEAIPKQQYDTQLATVAQFEAQIKSDQAAIDNAKLQLVYSKITIAFDRTHRAAAGGPGQHRSRHRCQRPGGDHAVAADRGDFQHRRGQPAGGPQEDGRRADAAR